MALNVLTGETLDEQEEKQLVISAKAAVECLWDADIQTLHKTNRVPLEINVGPSRAVAHVLLNDPKQESKAEKMAGPMTRYAAQMLNLPADVQNFELRVYSQSQFLCVEIPRLETWTPTFPEIEKLAAESVIIGCNAVTAEPVLLDLASDKAAPGAFLSAIPGGGKTNLLILTVAQLLARGWHVWLIDLKRGKDYRPLGMLPHLHRVAFTNETAGEMLADLEEEMEARNWGEKPSEPMIVLVVDEIRRLNDNNQETLLDLVTTGRSSGIRHLAATQHILEIDTKIAKTFDIKLAGQVADADESYYATGRKQQRAHEVLTEPGDFLYATKWAGVQHIKVPLADEPQLVGHVYEHLPICPDNGAARRAPSARSAEDEPASRRQAGDESQGDYIERVVPDGPIDLTAYWLPRTARQAHTILQQEAEKAGDGRKVPALDLIEWAISHVRESDDLPSFRSLQEAAGDLVGEQYSQARRREVRYLAGVVARKFDLAAGA